MVVAEGVECHKLALTLLGDTPFFRCLDPFGHSLSYGQSHLHYLLVHFHSHVILGVVSELLQQNHYKCQVISFFENMSAEDGVFLFDHLDLARFCCGS